MLLRCGMELELYDTRPLERADLAKPVETTSIKKISDRHHHLARCLSTGMSSSEAAIAAGYCLSRVSILLEDPLFKELIGFYREKKAEVFVDTNKMLAGLTNDAINELRNRLEDAPEKIPTKDLSKILSIAADRSGHGPTSTQQNLNISLSAKMKEAKERVINANPS